ncbi:MAG: SHOCT domain-containing protein [Actinobacteria bacterium]|nr:SHOCT domain-containing protein [Actinomycetota bacterium]
MSGSSLLFGFMGFIGTLVVLALIALLVVFLVKRAKGKKFGPGGPGGPGMGHHAMHRPPMPPALQILDERLANGDIEVEDYMTRKAALLGSNGPVTNEWSPQHPASAPSEAPKPASDDPGI